MKRMAIAALLVLTAGVTAVQGQNPQAAPVNPAPDSLRMMPPGPGLQGGPDGERLRELRMQVEERFGRMVQTQLDLTDPQMQQLRTAMRGNEDRRRNLMRREMDIQRAIGGQMTPGVAANNDSLTRMLDQVSRIRIERAQSDDQFQRELVFLPPVKRVRLIQMMRRMEEQIQNIARERREGGGMRGEGPRRPGPAQPGVQGERRPRPAGQPRPRQE